MSEERVRVVVIVDDDDDIRHLITLNISLIPQVEVYEFAKGETALKHPILATADVLVLDYMMPGINGAELAKAARLINRDCRIVIITAAADEPYDEFPDLKEAGDLLGAVIRTKPISVNDLEKLISAGPEEVFPNGD